MRILVRITYLFLGFFFLTSSIEYVRKLLVDCYVLLLCTISASSFERKFWLFADFLFCVDLVVLIFCEKGNMMFAALLVISNDCRGCRFFER